MYIYIYMTMLKNVYRYYYSLEFKDENNNNRKILKGVCKQYTITLAWAIPLEIPDIITIWATPLEISDENSLIINPPYWKSTIHPRSQKTQLTETVIIGF